MKSLMQACVWMCVYECGIFDIGWHYCHADNNKKDKFLCFIRMQQSTKWQHKHMGLHRKCACMHVCKLQYDQAYERKKKKNTLIFSMTLSHSLSLQGTTFVYPIPFT